MTDLALVADVHMRDAHASRIRDDLERVVETLDGRTDRAFVLGDLIEDGDDAATDRANVARVRDVFESAPFPVTYLLGNHDVENLSRATLSALLDQERFHGVMTVGDTPVVYLDSTVERGTGPRGRVGPEQRAWLADALEAHDDVLVAVHHPLGDFDLSDNAWFERYPERAFPTDRKEVLGVLAASGAVRGTVSGHIHQTDRVAFRGLSHVSINAFSKELPDVPLTGTFAEVAVDDGVTVDIGTRTGSVRFGLDGSVG